MRLPIRDWDTVYWKIMDAHSARHGLGDVADELCLKLDAGFVEQYAGASNIDRLVTIKTSAAEDACILELLGRGDARGKHEDRP